MYSMAYNLYKSADSKEVILDVCRQKGKKFVIAYKLFLKSCVQNFVAKNVGSLNLTSPAEN